MASSRVHGWVPSMIASRDCVIVKLDSNIELRVVVWQEMDKKGLKY